jgi:hypothetical protein
MNNEKNKILIEDPERNARDEIVDYAKKEAEEKKTAHFSLGGAEHFNSAELTTDDLAFWEKVKNGSVTEKDCEEYRTIYIKSDGNKSPSRHGFFSLAVNKASYIIGMRWLEEERKKEKEQQ